jgi:hypothetical protein
MKRLLFVALMAIVTVRGAEAQDNPTNTSQVNLNVAADFASTSAAEKIQDGFNSTLSAER